MLTLSVPQLFERPLGIRSGNLYEQMKDSWAADAAEKISSDERDFELNFFPDEEELDVWKDELRELCGYEENTEEQYEKLLNAFLDDLACTKEKEGGETVYSIEMGMDVVKELYLGWFDLYYSPLKTLGTVTGYEFDQVRTEFEESFDEFEKVVPQNPLIKCYVQDGRLDRITSTIFVDTSGAAGRFVNVDGIENTEQQAEETDGGSLINMAEGENSEDESAETGNGADFFLGAEADSSGISVRTSSGTEILQKGSLEFELVSWEEMAGIESTDINLYVRDENQEVFYYCNLFSGRFDSSTGHYDLTFSLTDRKTGAETDVKLESRFTDVVLGESFVWDIDRITFEQDEDSAELLNGQVRVCARPEELAQPEDPTMLFDLSEEELRQAETAIAQNLNSLLGVKSEEQTEE